MKRKKLNLEVDKEMSVIEHLTELRKCILKALVAWLLGTVISFYHADQLYYYLTEPFGITGLVYIAPAEGFLTYMRLAIYGGLLLTSPIILYQLVRFILPGLYKPEKRILYVLLPGAFLCMLAGMAFGYFVLLPYGLNYLMTFGSLRVRPMLSVQQYIRFVSNVLMILALIFQLPLIVCGLTRLKILNPLILRSNRKYALVLSVVLGAILTPPDVITQLMMAGPLLLLYEISIWVSYLWWWNQKKKERLTKDV